uniref:Uncharacterized protein n=1 Tax=Tanacetum cinerariifolium TaxID=118510 RepID=A0A6L2MD27_TANCI|nr:hypothetical protein [Tanacetum cinerariifolium]
MMGEVNEEWLMAPVTPPMMPVMPSPSIYEEGGQSTVATEGHSLTLLALGFPVPPSVIEDFCTRMGNLEYGHGQLVKKVIKVSDAEVADGIAIGDIALRVSAVEGQVHVMASQMVQVVGRLEQGSIVSVRDCFAKEWKSYLEGFGFGLDLVWGVQGRGKDKKEQDESVVLFDFAYLRFDGFEPGKVSQFGSSVKSLAILAHPANETVIEQRKDLMQMPVQNVTTMVASHVCKCNVKESFISTGCLLSSTTPLEDRVVQVCEIYNGWTCVAAPLVLDRTDLKLKVEVKKVVPKEDHNGLKPNQWLYLSIIESRKDAQRRYLLEV